MCHFVVWELRSRDETCCWQESPCSPLITLHFNGFDWWEVPVEMKLASSKNHLVLLWSHYISMDLTGETKILCSRCSDCRFLYSLYSIYVDLLVIYRFSLALAALCLLLSRDRDELCWPKKIYCCIHKQKESSGGI